MDTPTEMMELYKEEMNRLFMRLKSTKDWSKAQRIIHTMKGCALVVEQNAIANEFKRFETLDNFPHDWIETVEQLQERAF